MPNLCLSYKSVVLGSLFFVLNKEAMNTKIPRKTPPYSSVNTIGPLLTLKNLYSVGISNRRSLQDMWAPNVSSSFSVSGVALSLISLRTCMVLPGDGKHNI